MTEKHYFEMNRIGWDQRARAHFDSAFYDVQGFIGGKTSLREIELADLPDVKGKRMLHLQCHFGLDTLSWTRLGATCTGVDISPVAIKKADELAGMTHLQANFVCSDVYAFTRDQSEVLFDIVYTSYGAICWLPDLDKWAGVIADNLRPGGEFYMVEFHPLYDLLAGYSYFAKQLPDVEKEATYTENGEDAVAELATWGHPLGSVINALINSGIRIEEVKEYPFSPYNCFAGLVELEPGRYYLDYQGHHTPLVYSLRGRKI